MLKRKIFRGLGLGKTKGADPKVRAFVFDRRWRDGQGLGDDLGSLCEHCDGDRRDECEGGGDAEELGHFISLKCFCVC